MGVRPEKVDHGLEVVRCLHYQSMREASILGDAIAVAEGCEKEQEGGRQQ